MGTRPDRCSDTGREQLIRTGWAQAGRAQQIPGSRGVVILLGAAAAWFNYCLFFFFGQKNPGPRLSGRGHRHTPENVEFRYKHVWPLTASSGPCTRVSGLSRHRALVFYFILNNLTVLPDWARWVYKTRQSDMKKSFPFPGMVFWFWIDGPTMMKWVSSISHWNWSHKKKKSEV